MEWLGDLLQAGVATMLAAHESLLQLFLAAALGGIIGLEREASGKPAGFRTNLLICLGAALITQLSVDIARDITLPGGFGADPGRIAAQIVSGIGFLGAGTIIQARGSVMGLTTAATLWVVAAIGMAVGAAAYLQAIAGTLLVILALMLLGRFEDYLLPYHFQEQSLSVTVSREGDLLDRIEQHLTGAGYAVRVRTIERQGDHYVVSFSARGRRHAIELALRGLLAWDGVEKVSLGGR
jgi:putative Mg2+ transporter-C (MgtC) family protein